MDQLHKTVTIRINDRKSSENSASGKILVSGRRVLISPGVWFPLILSSARVIIIVYYLLIINAKRHQLCKQPHEDNRLRLLGTWQHVSFSLYVTFVGFAVFTRMVRALMAFFSLVEFRSFCVNWCSRFCGVSRILSRMSGNCCGYLLLWFCK